MHFQPVLTLAKLSAGYENIFMKGNYLPTKVCEFENEMIKLQ